MTMHSKNLRSSCSCGTGSPASFFGFVCRRTGRISEWIESVTRFSMWPRQRNLWVTDVFESKRRQPTQPEGRPVDQADVETSLTIRFRRRSMASSPTANTTIAAARYVRLSNRAPAIA